MNAIMKMKKKRKGLEERLNERRTEGIKERKT
jgi:hypothetical protein